MKRDEIIEYNTIVRSALDLILIAERTIDGRSREKTIKEAYQKAQNMVLPYRSFFEEELDLDNNGELFSWGFIKSDLERVHEELTEMIQTNKSND